MQLTRRPRNYSKQHLHIFVDTSVHSYGAAAYICNSTESKIVMARSRLTLSELELMAALIGARLATHLQNTNPTSSAMLWPDSQIVLHWLSCSKPLKRFIANRVEKICKLTKPDNWRYCPTRDNPADLVTRGIGAWKFLESDLWMTRPTWICNRETWPTWKKINNLVLQTSVVD